MNYDEKLEILKQILKANGLSYDDAEVFGFFNEERQTQPELFDDDVQRYDYSVNVKPELETVSPLDFENAYYAHGQGIKTLLDWFMYENAGSNPLVWENAGNPTFDIKISFEAEKKRDPILKDLNGRYFNYGDGNHRLATLIINCIIDFVKAKTEDKKKAVVKKYSMTLPVQIPITSHLSELLYKDYCKINPFGESIFPEQVRQYRTSSFENFNDSRYFVTYDKKTKLFKYNFNGVEFEGTQDELIDFMYEKKEETEPIMQWCADGVYYLSCNNQVFKSTNKEQIDNLIPKVKKAYAENKFELNNYLEVKDLQTNTYEICYSGDYFNDKEQGKIIATNVEALLLDDKNCPYFNKLENANFWRGKLADEVKRAFAYFGGFNLPELKFANLTKEEYVQAKQMFNDLDKLVSQLKGSSVEVE